MNQGWFETIIAGTDEENLTYESLDEVTHLDYFVGNPKQTQLTIEKSVTYGTADDLERDFKFQVILDGNTFAGTYKVIDSEGAETEKNTKDSDGYILIGHGDKAVIENINSGTIYSVREVSEESFTVSSEGNAGVLSVDADENVASFVNEKEKGYVRIEKST